MTRNQNHDDASTMNRIKTCDPWSDLNHDVLLLVMMQLGVVDFLAFSRVCKSWRLLAVSNKNKFIVSRPPMSISISTDANEKEHYYLKDFEDRMLKIILPHSADRKCIGVSCGYLIFSSEKTRDFWLVNPITRHELHFPFHDGFIFYPICLRAIFVFSPSISGWVFVVCCKYHHKIWFSVVGTREWTYVSTSSYIFGLLNFKGTIYTLHTHNRLCEVRLFPTPKVTLLEIKNFPKPDLICPLLASFGENLYVMDILPKYSYYNIQEINFSKMEWALREKLGEKCAFFCSSWDYGTPVVLAESWSQYKRYAYESEKGNFFYAKLWYFFHDCFNVNLLHE